MLMRRQLLFLVLGIFLSAQGVDDDQPLSRAAAALQLTLSGVTICSRGHCIDRNNSNCTSLEQIQRRCVNLVRELKTASRCRIVVTGGTETGHQPGTYSHWNGWKIDVGNNDCVTSYITSNFRRIHNSFSHELRYLSHGKYVWTKKGHYWCISCASFPDQ